MGEIWNTKAAKEREGRERVACRISRLSRQFASSTSSCFRGPNGLPSSASNPFLHQLTNNKFHLYTGGMIAPPHSHAPLPPFLLAVLLLAALGCNLTGIAGDGAKPASPVPPVQEASPTTPPQSQPSAAAGTGTVHAPVISGTPPVIYWFSEEQCACGNLPVQAEARYGAGALECRFAWAGEYIDDNSIYFSILQLDDTARLDKEFSENLGWIQDAAQTDQAFIDSGSLPDDQQYIARNELNGFSFVTTGPGGGSSKTNTEIPMCGNGSGVLRVYGKFLVEIRLFACDLGSDRDVYMTMLETLEDCALSSIDQAIAARP